MIDFNHIGELKYKSEFEPNEISRKLTSGEITTIYAEDNQRKIKITLIGNFLPYDIYLGIFGQFIGLLLFILSFFLTRILNTLVLTLGILLFLVSIVFQIKYLYENFKSNKGSNAIITFQIAFKNIEEAKEIQKKIFLKYEDKLNNFGRIDRIFKRILTQPIPIRINKEFSLENLNNNTSFDVKTPALSLVPFEVKKILFTFNS